MSQFSREQETYTLPATGAGFPPLLQWNTVSGPMCASGLLFSNEMQLAQCRWELH